MSKDLFWSHELVKIVSVTKEKTFGLSMVD